jgi:hypothetical protein
MEKYDYSQSTARTIISCASIAQRHLFLALMQRARRIEAWTSRHASSGLFVSQKVNAAMWSLQVHDFRNVPAPPYTATFPAKRSPEYRIQVSGYSIII